MNFAICANDSGTLVESTAIDLKLKMASSVSVTSTDRVVALVDMDCFYVQVEERDDPSIKGVPAAVVQYKSYKGGGIIAVNYEARAKGVSRNIRGDDAKALCPEIQLVRVPETRGKADLTKYRDAGREVINVLMEFSSSVERASVDEAYIDLTEAVETRLAEISSSQSFLSWGESVLKSLNHEFLENNHVLGYESTKEWFDGMEESELPSMDNLKLAIGAEIVGKMRDAVYRKTSFRCSAGIAHNKVVAKLVCGINKPNKQTVLPHSAVAMLWATTKIGKVRGLGGKLGDYLMEKLGCEKMSDLSRFTERELCAQLGSKTGAWLYQLSLGYDDEPVVPRQLPKSIGCNKNFYGPEALKTKEKAKFWINQLAAEVVERIQRDLETNNRRAKSLTLHVKFEDQNPLSRSCGVNPNYNTERLASDVFVILDKLYQSVGVIPINSLGLIASKFEDEVDISSNTKINDYFQAKSKSGENSTSLNLATEDKIVQSNKTIEPGDQLKISDLDVAPKNNGLANLSNSKQPVPSGSTIKIVSSSHKQMSLPTESNASSSSFESTSETETANLTGTPKKTNSESKDLQQPFFSFSTSAPQVPSPRKSPRKLFSVAGKSGGNSMQSELVPGFQEQEKECERCGKRLSLRDYATHMDHHLAKDLSRELNGLPALEFDQRPETLRKKEAELAAAKVTQKRPRGRGAGPGTSGSKRGRGAKTTTSSAVSNSLTQGRTIDSYFGRKS